MLWGGRIPRNDSWKKVEPRSRRSRISPLGLIPIPGMWAEKIQDHPQPLQEGPARLGITGSFMDPSLGMDQLHAEGKSTASSSSRGGERPKNMDKNLQDGTSSGIFPAWILVVRFQGDSASKWIQPPQSLISLFQLGAKRGSSQPCPFPFPSPFPPLLLFLLLLPRPQHIPDGKGSLGMLHVRVQAGTDPGNQPNPPRVPSSAPVATEKGREENGGKKRAGKSSGVFFFPHFFPCPKPLPRDFHAPG